MNNNNECARPPARFTPASVMGNNEFYWSGLTAFIQQASEVVRTEIVSLAISQCEDLLEKMNIGILQRFVDGKFSGGIRHENDTVHA